MLRGVQALAERRHMLGVPKPLWGLGHGSLCDLTMLSMAGQRTTITEGLRILTQIVSDGKFIFVTSTPADPLLTVLADALDPGEYQSLGTLSQRLKPIFNSGHYRGGWAASLTEIQYFVNVVASHVRVGIFRASHEAGGKVFCCHEDDFDKAALIAISDSALQPVRGFPMLLDVADYACSRSVMSGGTFTNQFNAAVIGAGSMLRHLSERAYRYDRTA